MSFACSKSYDIRGYLVDELNEDIALRISRALVELHKMHCVKVSCDQRPISASAEQSIAGGIDGVDLTDIGLTGVEV